MNRRKEPVKQKTKAQPNSLNERISELDEVIKVLRLADPPYEGTKIWFSEQIAKLEAEKRALEASGVQPEPSGQAGD